MKNEDWIEEDWEQMFAKDYMDRIEREMDIEEQWRSWEENQQRLPAKIEVLIYKDKEYE
jgi:hypothetical protein